MLPELKDHLLNNPTSNLPVLGFFDNYPLEKYYVYNKSLILTGTSDYTWAYLSVPEANDFEILLEKFAFSTLYFANVEEWMIPQLTENHRVDWKLFTNRYYLPDDIEVAPSGLESTPLDLSYAGFIYQNSGYKDYTSEKYITDRLSKDVSAGIWMDGNLAGWGLTHDDGSLGFLNVASEYRGQGIGEAIFRALIASKRAKGKAVFLNIEPQNKQSIGLIQKIGLVYDRPVSWIKLS